jgi:peptide/nickel transport system permease protein
VRSYIIRRLLLAVPTIFLVTIIVFMTIRMVPGSVVDMMASNLQITNTVDKQAIEAELGLDVPILTQYLRWLGVVADSSGVRDGLIQGSLGDSLWTKTPISRDIASRWPVTFELSLIGLVVSLIIALPIGIYSAIRQDTVGDYIARSFGVLLIAIPAFWIGTMVIVFPSVWWGYMPRIRYIPFTRDPWENLKLMIIPGIIIGMGMSGTVLRMTRTMMLDVLRQDYIRTAWAKGLGERVVILRHALKNALIPVITISGLQVPLLIGEAVIVEQIFSLPGLGTLLIKAVSARDYPIVSAVLLLIAVLVVLTNTIVDLTYRMLDPRIRND